MLRQAFCLKDHELDPQRGWRVNLFLKFFIWGEYCVKLPVLHADW